MNPHATYTEATLRVAAPVDDPELAVFAEVMAASSDPAHPDQAVIANVPFLIDGLNFGDLVRLGPADEHGVRPILEVVVPSGHVHLLAATEDDEALDLVAHLERNFASYALQIECAHEHLVSVSVHPDLDPRGVRAAIEAWLAQDAEDAEEGLAVGPACASRVGPVFWVAGY